VGGKEKAQFFPTSCQEEAVGVGARDILKKRGGSCRGGFATGEIGGNFRGNQVDCCKKNKPALAPPTSVGLRKPIDWKQGEGWVLAM